MTISYVAPITAEERAALARLVQKRAESKEKRERETLVIKAQGEAVKQDSPVNSEDSKDSLSPLHRKSSDLSRTSSETLNTQFPGTNGHVEHEKRKSSLKRKCDDDADERRKKVKITTFEKPQRDKFYYPRQRKEGEYRGIAHYVKLLEAKKGAEQKAAAENKARTPNHENCSNAEHHVKLVALVKLKELKNETAKTQTKVSRPTVTTTGVSGRSRIERLLAGKENEIKSSRPSVKVPCSGEGKSTSASKVASSSMQHSSAYASHPDKDGEAQPLVSYVTNKAKVNAEPVTPKKMGLYVVPPNTAAKRKLDDAETSQHTLQQKTAHKEFVLKPRALQNSKQACFINATMHMMANVPELNAGGPLAACNATTHLLRTDDEWDDMAKKRAENGHFKRHRSVVERNLEKDKKNRLLQFTPHFVKMLQDMKKDDKDPVNPIWFHFLCGAMMGAGNDRPMNGDSQGDAFGFLSAALELQKGVQ